MISRPQIGLLIAACCLLAGCRAQPPITRADLVGSYAYKSEDPSGRATDHEWDRLTVQADGRYDLVQGGPTKPKTETVGVWTLIRSSSTAHGPELLLDRAGYPIQIKGNQVRLLIDEDTGIWYVKVK
jgi:hypothetical protein